MPPKPAAATDKLDIVFIIGPEIDPENIRTQYKKATEAGLKCLIVGNGKDPVTDKDLQALSGRIDSSTSINIDAHGLARNGTHDICIGDDFSNTNQFLQKLSSFSPSSPLNVHLWSCYSGAAAKDVTALPEGSVLTTCSEADIPALTSMCDAGIERLVDDRIARQREYKADCRQATLDNFANETTCSSATLTLAANKEGKAVMSVLRQPKEPLVADLPRYLEAGVTKFNEFRRDTLGEDIDVESKTQEVFARVSPREMQERLEIYNRNALALSVARGDAKKVEAFLEQGFDPNTRDRDGPPLLCMAVEDGHSKVITTLLRGGADPEQTHSGKTAEHMAMILGKDKVVAAIRNNPTPQELSGFTSLHFAARRGEIDRLNFLAEANPEELNAVSAQGLTPAMVALLNGNIPACESLASKGSALNFTPEQIATIKQRFPEAATTLDNYTAFDEAAKAIIAQTERSILEEQRKTNPKAELSPAARERLAEITKEVRASLIQTYGLDGADRMKADLDITTAKSSDKTKQLGEAVKAEIGPIRKTGSWNPMRQNHVSFDMQEQATQGATAIDKMANIKKIFASKDTVMENATQTTAKQRGDNLSQSIDDGFVLVDIVSLAQGKGAPRQDAPSPSVASASTTTARLHIAKETAAKEASQTKLESVSAKASIQR